MRIVLLLLIGFLFLPASAGASNGALVSFGDKWGWAGSGRAFTPQLVMYATPDRFYNQPAKVDAAISLFSESTDSTAFIYLSNAAGSSS